MSDNNKKKKLDPSTLNFNAPVEAPGKDSQKRAQNRFQRNLHVRNTVQELDNMVMPRGFDVRVHTDVNIHKNRLAEGCLVTVYCDNINPNELCRREEEELEHLLSTKFKIIREKPYELKGFYTGNTKIITEIDTEEKAKKAFNLLQENDKVFGNL